MSRFTYRLPLLLTVTGALYCFPAVPPSGAAILEPDFTRAPVRNGNLNLCPGSFPAGKCNPAQEVSFIVDKPYDFSAITNNSEFDIDDFHLTIVGPAGVTWGDVDGNEFVGRRGDFSSASIFQSTKVSADGKTIDLSKGKIAKGEAFNPLFIVGGVDDVQIKGFFTVAVIPEPGTLSYFGAMVVAALALAAWQRLR